MSFQKRKSEQNAAMNGGNETRRQWRKPLVTRIEIKRTMLANGSQNDGFFSASSNQG